MAGIVSTGARSLKVNWVLATTGLSGGVKSNRLVAEALARRGHDVAIYYSSAAPRFPFWKGPRAPAEWWRQYRRHRVLIRNHHLMRSQVPVFPVRRSPIRADDVRDADVTIATWWETAEWIADWPTSKGAKGYFIRHYEVHGGDATRVDATYRLPYQKFVIAKWLQRLMRDKFDDDSAILVPNGVDRTQFHTATRERNEVVRVGMLFGRQQWKGADAAFAALVRLQKRIRGLRVVAFGSSAPPNNALLPENFQFILRPPQSEIRSIYCSADCWLVPSVSEGFGMPGLEAAACGCPLVVTRCGGPQDYVLEGENGFSVAVGDESGMVDRLEEVLTLPDRRWVQMSEASRRVASRFDWDHSAGLLEAALHRMCAQT